MRRKTPLARPTKYSEATAEKIASGIRLGLTDKDASAVAGISEPTLFRWRRRYESVENLIARAHAQHAARFLAKIQDCGSSDWRMWSSLPERRSPEYRLRSAVELSGAEGGPSEIVGIELPLPIRTDDDQDDEERETMGRLLIPLPSASNGWPR